MEITSTAPPAAAAIIDSGVVGLRTMPRGFLVKRVGNMPLLSPSGRMNELGAASPEDNGRNANCFDEDEENNSSDEAYTSPSSADALSMYGGIGSPDSGFSGSPAQVNLMPPPLLPVSYLSEAQYLGDKLHDMRRSHLASDHVRFALQQQQHSFSAAHATELAAASGKKNHNQLVDMATAMKLSQWQGAMEMLAKSAGTYSSASLTAMQSALASSPRAINALTDHIHHIYSGLLQKHAFANQQQHLQQQLPTAAATVASNPLTPGEAKRVKSTVRRLNFDEEDEYNDRLDELRKKQKTMTYAVDDRTDDVISQQQVKHSNYSKEEIKKANKNKTGNK